MALSSISMIENHITESDSCWDNNLIAKYDVAGPRYTSYPTVPNFDVEYDTKQYCEDISAKSLSNISPLSLYVHIPFCQNICYYCACNKVVTSDKSVSRRYLDHLEKEMRLQSELSGTHRTVMQLHFGGGTPTFLDGAQLTELMHYLATHFSLTDSDRREYSIEIDPRTISKDSLALLKGLGFNRLSLGVQDFDEKVQKAINRHQSFDMIEHLTQTARLHQFKSISYDLIYGLPFQTKDSLSETIDKVILLSPDRIAFYNYAHLPERFKSQRSIDRHDLPTAQEKIELFTLVAKKLIAADYVHIGMDHFVKKTDALYKAQQQAKLQRNFQGYSTCMAPDLVGLGVSAISSMDNRYVQNAVQLEDYYQQLDEDKIPINKGISLSVDDCLRREIIAQISCDLYLNVNDINEKYQIDFHQYFKDEIIQLYEMEKDGLLQWQDENLLVSTIGRLMLRNICMVFDKYLQQGVAVKFSKSL